MKAVIVRCGSGRALVRLSGMLLLLSRCCRMLGCFQVLLVTAKGRVGGTGGTGGLLPTVPADCCRICCYLPVVACCLRLAGVGCCKVCYLPACLLCLSSVLCVFICPGAVLRECLRIQLSPKTVPQDPTQNTPNKEPMMTRDGLKTPQDDLRWPQDNPRQPKKATRRPKTTPIRP